MAGGCGFNQAASLARSGVRAEMAQLHSAEIADVPSPGDVSFSQNGGLLMIGFN